MTYILEYWLLIKIEVGQQPTAVQSELPYSALICLPKPTFIIGKMFLLCTAAVFHHRTERFQLINLKRIRDRIRPRTWKNTFEIILFFWIANISNNQLLDILTCINHLNEFYFTLPHHSTLYLTRTSMPHLYTSC